MRRWYSERRTALARWAPQTTPEAPHGGGADHPGEITVRTNSGPVRLRRIFRIPEGFEAASLEDLREAAVDAERRP